MNASSEVDAALTMECLHYVVICCLISQSESGTRGCVSVCEHECMRMCLPQGIDPAAYGNAEMERSRSQVAGKCGRIREAKQKHWIGPGELRYIQGAFTAKALNVPCMFLPKQHLGEQGYIRVHTLFLCPSLRIRVMYNWRAQVEREEKLFAHTENERTMTSKRPCLPRDLTKCLSWVPRKRLDLIVSNCQVESLGNSTASFTTIKPLQ